MSIILGIDLGTSTSEVAIMVNGKVEVLKDKNGDKIIPSVVGISETGEIIVGRDSKDQLLTRPKDTVMEVKRLMGSDKSILMKGKEYKPEEISALILKYIKESAEEYLGEAIERAVITVPAYFTDIQRRATVKAGKLAGLKVERIINEPTAAALSYGIDHMKDDEHILVYDLGGGTLDITVLEMFDGVLDVKASSGNNNLGGKDFDEKLMEYIINNFYNEHSIHLREDLRALARIKEAAENCKIALSKDEEYLITLPFIAEKGNKPIALNQSIRREEFENLIHDLIKQSKKPLEIALKDAKIAEEDIGVILLVGGSTRIPLVKRFLEEELKKEPKDLVDPDLAVVKGAAIQSALLSGELSGEEDILITDVCPYTLGIETLDFIQGMPIEDVYDVIINRNTTIPVSKEKIYYTCVDNQDKIEIKVYQGDNKRASLNNFLGNFMLTGVPKALAGEERIKVKFIYDVNGILNVDATIISTGKKASITIETTGVEMVKEIDLDTWKDCVKSKQYRGIIRRAEKLLEEHEDSDLYEELEYAISQIKKAIVKNEDDSIISDIEKELTDIMYELEDN